MAISPERPTACASCGAAVRGDVSWCVICYRPLAVQVDEVDEVDEPEAPETSERTPDVGAGEGTARTATAETGLRPGEEIADLADRLLLELAASRPGQGSWTSRLPATGTGRTALVVAAIVAGCAALVLVMTVAGLVV